MSCAANALTSQSSSVTTPDTPVTVKTGSASKLTVKGRGANLELPPLPLAMPVTLQLQATDAGCFEMTYSASGVVTNDAMRVRARADLPPP